MIGIFYCILDMCGLIDTGLILACLSHILYYTKQNHKVLSFRADDYIPNHKHP